MKTHNNPKPEAKTSRRSGGWLRRLVRPLVELEMTHRVALTRPALCENQTPIQECEGCEKILRYEAHGHTSSIKAWRVTGWRGDALRYNPANLHRFVRPQIVGVLRRHLACKNVNSSGGSDLPTVKLDSLPRSLFGVCLVGVQNPNEEPRLRMEMIVRRAFNRHTVQINEVCSHKSAKWPNEKS